MVRLWSVGGCVVDGLWDIRGAFVVVDWPFVGAPVDALVSGQLLVCLRVVG